MLKLLSELYLKRGVKMKISELGEELIELDEFVAEFLEQLTQEQIESIRVYELTKEENEE